MLAVIDGDLGSGKTLFQSFVGSVAIQKKIDVFSNYSLFGAKKLDLVRFSNSEYSNAIILIDEAYNYIDSRNSMSAKNKILSYVMFQSRKKNVIMILSVQLFYSLDVRFRNLVDIRIHAEEIRNGFLYTITNGKAIKRLFLPYSIAKKIYPLYNTNEVIKTDETEAIYSSFETREQKIERYDTLIEQMKEDNLKITMQNVKAWLFEHGGNPSDVSMLYTLAKNREKNE